MRRRAHFAALLLAVLAVGAPALAAGPAGLPVPELPVLHPATQPGTSSTPTAGTFTPGTHTVDGLTDDWHGTGTSFGGTIVRSAGELVYTDHLFDAYGADDGTDADRLGKLEPLNEAVPETYRLEPIFTSDIVGELGGPGDTPLSASETYGDAGRQDVADLLDVRLAPGPDELNLLARTTSMAAPTDTALLVLVDTVDGSPAYEVPFGAGIRTESADVAVLVADGAGVAVDLATNTTTPVPVAVDATGYSNAIEAALPARLLTGGRTWEDLDRVRVAVAAGRYDPALPGFADLPEVPANLANVAFRTAEPVTVFFESQQAVALNGGSIDEFLLDVDLAALRAGVDETWTPGPGYHDRIFLSSPSISTEGGTEGIYQHYGLYLPSTYNPATPAPLTFWLHWRGGKAHSAATVAPRIFRDQGEAIGGVVISPRGRGTSSWYLGKGLVDFNEVWADAFASFALDPDRVVVSGHSMGGWGSYLLSILYPDRFAAAFPVAGPVTQGAWTGLDFEGCDDMQFEEYTPCYIGANDSDPRTQHTRPLLENVRNVPLAIFQGAADELVPVSGVTRQVEQLAKLGFRHRYFVFPTYEHYSHPINDEWAEGVRYTSSFRRDPNPVRVSYVRDMAFERTVETGPSQKNPTAGLSFDFDRAYWMSELTPVDETNGVARFDGRTLTRRDDALLLPEAGGPTAPGQVGPFTMTGLAWLTNPLPAPAAVNGFAVTLEGVKAVRLDLARMGVVTPGAVTGTVTADAPIELRLAGAWVTAPVVRIGSAVVTATVSGGVLRFAVPAGISQITVG